MKKALIIATIIMYILTSALISTSPALAIENTKAEISSSKKEETKKEKTETKDEEEKYSPKSRYLLMIDLDSSRILYEDDSDKEFNPGGLVKILTAITAIENCNDLSKKVSPKMPVLDGYDYESNGNIGLEYGEEISIQNLIEAMMTTDAGDCALTIAHNVGKSYDNFINLMNETAKKAGAQSSVFTDPAGFDKKFQKTTLEDMCKITQYALNNKTFASIAAKGKVEIPSTNKTSTSRVIFNTNHFLSKYYSLNYYNPNVCFAKTYYNSAEDCGIIAQYKDSKSNLLILCGKSQYTLNNSGYDDVNYLIEYANENFIQMTLISEDEFVYEAEIDNGYNSDRVLLVSSMPVKVKLEKGYDTSKIKKEVKLNGEISAPIKKGQFLGTATVFYDGEKCGEVKLVSYSDIEKSNVTYLKNKIRGVVGSGYFKLFIAILILIFVLKAFRINKKKTS